MAEERSPAGKSVPPIAGRAEGDEGAAQPGRPVNRRAAYVQRPTMRGIAPAPHLGVPKPGESVPEPPDSDSWVGTTVQPIEEVGGSGPFSLTPERIVSVGSPNTIQAVARGSRPPPLYTPARDEPPYAAGRVEVAHARPRAAPLSTPPPAEPAYARSRAVPLYTPPPLVTPPPAEPLYTAPPEVHTPVPNTAPIYPHAGAQAANARPAGDGAEAAVNPYAVLDNEQTLFDHRADPYPQSGPEPAAAAAPSTQMVAFRQPVQASMAVSVAEPPPPPTPLVQRRVHHQPDPRLVLLTEPDSQRAASFRLLRDNLLAQKVPRVIAVSSGAAHEGKTTCALNLAIALSEQPSTRVLLLEGNFFAPSLGRIFDIDAMTPPAQNMNQPWLAPYRVAEVMRGFHVAAVVQQKGEPIPAFNSRWFDIAIGHLSGAGYDHLVIDCAALDGSAAVAQVVGVADGTLLTVQSGGTTARSLRRAVEQIPPGRALGVTLMDGDA